MNLIQIAILAVVQGLAEMLPVSSSAHVILAEKFLGLDPSRPELTFLLVMLHTGTMFAAILYFGRRWLKRIRPDQDSSGSQHREGGRFLALVVLGTMVTGVVGLLLKKGIEKVIMERLLGHEKGEIEMLFSNLPLIGVALFAAGVLILLVKRREKQTRDEVLTSRKAVVIGLVQGLCLPFRGFSRSGATISTGMSQGVSRALSEEFSFALAVALTPAVVLLEFKRLRAAPVEAGSLGFSIGSQLTPGLIGLLLSFVAGLLALKWLSSWLESGRWHIFGYYCLVFSGVIFTAAFFGY